MKTHHEIAHEICAESAYRSPELLGAELERKCAEHASEIFKEWCFATARRYLADKARATPQARAQREAATLTVVRELGRRGIRGSMKAIDNFFEDLRLPDGRLFADVSHYEYGVLKRDFTRWVGFIEAVEAHIRVNDDKLTAREFMKEETYKALAEKAGLVARKAA